jgi:methionyl-tRNA formyltransferase
VAAGSGLLVTRLAAGLGEGEPQEGTPTYAQKLAPDELALVWERPAAELERVVRLDRAYASWRGRRLRVLDARAAPAAGPDGADGVSSDSAPPGSLIGDEVVTGRGRLRLLRVQAAGSVPMDAAAWRRGAHVAAGDRFDDGTVAAKGEEP